MKQPLSIEENTFQKAWAKAILALREEKWELWSLVVRFTQPKEFEESIHTTLCDYASSHGFISPNDIEHTIFPTRLYNKYPDKKRFFRAYRIYFQITRKMEHSGWGTYFNSMINYPTKHGTVDQLGDMINNISNREKIIRAANVIIIPEPYRDRNKIIGAPCLNYITVQVEKDEEAENCRRISLLCVYRNHDFTVRAYGNYLGLCGLLNYICSETHSSMGGITCISSHASVPNYKRELTKIANGILRSSNE